MVDKEKLAKYIRDLELYLNQIAELQKSDKQEFLRNWKVYDLAERKLHLVLETYLSIGEMVISEFGFRKPEKYSDIPRILCDNQIIPKDLSEKLIELAKFRNVLVHEYLYLDHERVYEHLQKDLFTVHEFLNCIKEFVREKE